MAKKLNIGLVFDDSLDRPDGVQQYVRTVGRWMRDQGHQVSYLVGETSGEIDEAINLYSLAKNISIKGNQNRLSLPLPASTEKIKALLSEQYFDVVHVQMPYNPLLSGRVITRLHPTTAVVGTFHIVSEKRFEKYGSKVLSKVQKRTLKCFDEIVSVSTAAKEYSAKHFGIRSSVIPNAIDLRPFANAKAQSELRTTKFNVFFLNRLVERKGAQHLLAAIDILNKSGDLDDVSVRIGSKGELMARLKQFVKDNNLERKVTFDGFIEEAAKPAYLASADLCVFPSTGGESFGIVLIEAMATKKAVVLAGNNAGYATVMDDHHEMLFDPLDHQDLADRILELKNSQKKFKRLNNWQRERVLKYDISVVGPKLEAIYQKAIAKRLEGQA